MLGSVPVTWSLERGPTRMAARDLDQVPFQRAESRISTTANDQFEPRYPMPCFRSSAVLHSLWHRVARDARLSVFPSWMKAGHIRIASSIWTEGSILPSLSVTTATIGHWEGDIGRRHRGLREKFWMDTAGTPHTAQLHCRASPGPTNALQYQATIEDPGAYTAPGQRQCFDAVGTNNDLFEYICQTAITVRS
jgi:hypothetical protein